MRGHSAGHLPLRRKVLKPPGGTTVTSPPRSQQILHPSRPPDCTPKKQQSLDEIILDYLVAGDTE